MIVITGSDGQVGIELQKQLKKNRINYLALNKKKLNITSSKSIKNNFDDIKNLRMVINLAAFTNVEKCEDDLSPNYQVNFIGVKNICKYIKNRNILLVHISTDYLFDGKKKCPYVEADITNPLNEYGKAKQKAEIYIKKNILSYVILRSSWIFSKHKSSFFNFIDNFHNKKLSLIDDIYGNPTSARSLSIAIISIIKKQLKKNNINYGIYHYCNHPPANWLDLGRFYMTIKRYNLSKLSNTKSNLLNLKAIRPKNSMLSSDKFEKEFEIKKIYWKKEIRNFF